MKESVSELIKEKKKLEQYLKYKSYCAPNYALVKKQLNEINEKIKEMKLK